METNNKQKARLVENKTDAELLKRVARLEIAISIITGVLGSIEVYLILRILEIL